MLWALILLLFLGSLKGAEGQQEYREAPWGLDSRWHFMPDFISNYRLTYLTEEIMKDVELKMVMIHYIQSSYHGSFDFEVGFMAARTKDLFRHMIQIYKHYSRPQFYANRTNNARNYIDALHRIQGDYKEILVYRDTYLKVTEAEAVRNKRTRQIIRFKQMKKKTQDNLQESKHHAFSREITERAEQMRPPKEFDYGNETRTLKPGQNIPQNSREWEALNTQRGKLRNRKDPSVSSEDRSKKKEEEEKYKALLREKYNKARRGARQDTGF